jgi:hypothetical protein
VVYNEWILIKEFFMGRMKELAMSIDEMLMNGYDVEDIALILEVDIELVKQRADTTETNQEDLY